MIPLAVVALVVMVGATEAEGAAGKLFGNRYDSTSVVRNGEPHELVEGTSIAFGFERREGYDVASWHAGCNHFGARVEIRPRRLLTGQILGTEMACTDALHRQDRWLERFFRRDPRWALRGTRLRLRSGDDVIRLRRRSPGPVDTTPPKFAGLEGAIACIAGPGLYDAPFHLRWQPAADDRTPPWLIVYDIYLATEPGAEDFSQPTWTTPPGATRFTTPDFAPYSSVFIVVRARDQAGNEDRNTVERQGIYPCV